MFTLLRDLLGGPTGLIDPSVIPVTPNDQIPPDEGDSRSVQPPLPIAQRDQPHPDADAAHVLAIRVEALKSSVYHLPRLCHIGCIGSDVLAYKRALVKSGARPPGLEKSLTPRQRRTFGAHFRSNVERFQHNHGITPDGVIGPTTLHTMTPYIDAYGAYMLHQEAKWISRHQATIDPHLQASHHALRAVALASLWHYAEIRPYPIWEPSDHTPTTTDCSGGFGLWAHWGGMRSPFGDLGWTGYGNTDSMMSAGVHTSNPGPGDAILYSNPGHVVMCVRWPYGVSHGSESAPYYLDCRYRSITTFRRF